ncbi:MAG: ABC transporter substrate-binding protein [Myxococcota bacterium]
MTAWSRRRALAALGLSPLWASPLACGRSNERRAEPGRRIASQTVLSDEVLWDLGHTVRQIVVAVSPMADDTRYCRVANLWPQDIPRVSGSSEALIATAPDLVILASFTATETRTMVERAGLKTLVLDRFDGFDDYRDNVQRIADAVGASDEGKTLVAQFDERLATLSTDPPKRPQVVSWTEGSVPGANTSFHDIAVAAGFENLPAVQGKSGHLQVSVEELVTWDPEVLVVPCGVDDCDAVAAEVRGRAGLRATRAARNGRVVAIPSRDLYSVGAGMLDAVKRLREQGAGSTP